MKISRIYLSLSLIFALAMFSACGTQKAANGAANNTGNNAANNTVAKDNTSTGNGQNSAPANGGANSEQAKSTHVFPEMPSIIMKSEMKALDGTKFTLKQLEGKTVLINLWATWCGPCRMEMPELVKLEDEYKDKGFMVLGLDTDDSDTEEMVKTFVERQQLNYKIGWTSDEVNKGLLDISRAGVIPQSFLITKDGRLAGVFKGFAPNRTIIKMRETIDDVLTRTTE
jgi:thiol-disulfide isomerase/thioredoxin